MLLQLLDGSSRHGPPPPPGTQAFRFRADLGITKSGSNITGWADQSGNGLNLTVPATYSSPQFNASYINGIPAAVFAAGSGGTALFNASNAFAANGARSILVIGKSADNIGGVTFTQRLSSAVWTTGWGQISGTNYVYSDGATSSESIATAPTANASVVMLHTWDGTIGGNPFFSINGTGQSLTGGTGAQAETGTAGFTIGNRQDAGSGIYGWSGGICEIIGWARALNATEILQVKAYVLATYGLTIGADYLQTVDQTTKTGGVELVHATQSWINDSNRVWSGKTIRRYNRALVRLTGWTSSSVKLRAICSPLTNADGKFAVVVDGVYQTSFTVTADALSHDVTVSGLTVSGGGSTVEIWEGWGSKPGAQNTGSDGQVEEAFVNGLYLTAPQAAVAQAPSTAIICIGDSIMGFVVGSSNPEASDGGTGQLRLLAEAKGWQLATLDYGGSCMMGDGLTAANYITWINETISSLGNPTDVRILAQPFYNDYADYGTNGVSKTPTDAQTFLQAIHDGMPASVSKFVTVSMLTTYVANTGGFTCNLSATPSADYAAAINAVTGSNVTHIDGTTFGLVGGDFSGPHLKPSGVTKWVAGVHGAIGV